MLKLSMQDFKHDLTSMRDEWNCPMVWTFLTTALLGNWHEDWPFPVLWSLLGLPDLLKYWVQHFNSIIFRVLNSSTGIPFHPLALLTAVLPKAHLTSHSRMSRSGWMTTPLWLSGSLRSVLHSSVYFFHLSWSLQLLLGLYFFCPLLCQSLSKCSIDIFNLVIKKMKIKTTMSYIVHLLKYLPCCLMAKAYGN